MANSTRTVCILLNIPEPSNELPKVAESVKEKISQIVFPCLFSTSDIQDVLHLDFPPDQHSKLKYHFVVFNSEVLNSPNYRTVKSVLEGFSDNGSVLTHEIRFNKVPWKIWIYPESA